MIKNISRTKLGILVGQKKFDELNEILITLNSIDIADFMDELPVTESHIIFRKLPKNIATEVFSELDLETQIKFAESISSTEITFLMDSLATDDAVDMLEEMPPELVTKILRQASEGTRTLLNKYLNYSEKSTGSIMTAEYTSFDKNHTVKEAIELIRTHGEDKETVYVCYVIEGNDELIGTLNIRNLMAADDDDIVSNIMEKNIISVTTNTDKEEASLLLRKYGFISLPVTDSDNHLVGIVTIDDAADVLLKETTEDMEKMSAMAPSEKPYLKSSVITLSKNRFFWLFILMLSGTVSEFILSGFESAISSIPLLAAFIPLLTDMGGDAGSQTSTLIVRGMAIGEIKTKNLPVILFKEFSISMLVGIPLGIVNFIRIIITNPGQPMVALSISLTLIFTILMANMLGSLLPIIAKSLKIDPAIMASPMVSTLVDILSILLYFSIATVLLGL